MHAPSTAYEKARTQAALGLLVEARDTIAEIRRLPSKPNDPAPFKEARSKAEELDTELSVRVPALTIAIKGVPDGETAAVTIDSEQVPASALGLPHAVDPGHHVVVAKSPTAEGKLEVDVKEGDQKPAEVTLVSTGAPAAQAATDESEPEQPAPKVVSHSPTLLTWDAGAFAVVGIAVGSVTGIMSLSKKSALQNECTNDVCGPSSYADYNAANSLATASTIAFIAAGVGVAVAAVTLIVGHKTSTPPAAAPAAATARPTLTPWIGLGAGGVSGTF